MELIVGFKLSSYSHCTSYTRLTTDTGNCCRACDWPFIKRTDIVSGLFLRGMIILRKIITNGPSHILQVIATSFTGKVFIIGAQILKVVKSFYSHKTHNMIHYH